MSKRNRAPAPREPNPAEKLQALIDAEQVKRAQACLVEVEAVLKRHNCRMRAEFLAADGKMEGRVNIIALPKDVATQ